MVNCNVTNVQIIGAYHALDVTTRFYSGRSPGCISCMLESRSPVHNFTDHLVQQDTLHYLPKTSFPFPEKDLDIEFPTGDTIVIQLKGVRRSTRLALANCYL